jgi:hypothetical protein
MAVEQQRRHHRRIERRLPPIDAIDRLDLFQVDLLHHQAQNKPRQMILCDKFLNRRRQQHRLADLPRAIALAHQQAESDSSRKRQSIRDFSDRLLVLLSHVSQIRRAFGFAILLIRLSGAGRRRWGMRRTRVERVLRSMSIR